MIDTLLIVLGIISLIGGLAGCIVPVIPGPPLSFLALMLLEWTELVDIDNQLLWILFAVTVIVTVLDYFLPIWFVKKSGASKRATWGATIGLIVGLIFFPPIGIIIGPLVGAYIGEITVSSDAKKAIKGSLATFGGFVFGTLLKFMISGYMTWVFIRDLWIAI
ncbi:MAG TPA: DUF456 domain-containing protein [Salinivirgaceae bacterium]|nr:DUF456 domain-containing protein [Salinivirgaceae bacterium]